MTVCLPSIVDWRAAYVAFICMCFVALWAYHVIYRKTTDVSCAASTSVLVVVCGFLVSILVFWFSFATRCIWL